MQDPRIEQLGRLIAGYSLELREGQVVRIDGFDVAAPLALAVYRAAVCSGRRGRTRTSSSTGLHELLLEEGSDEQIAYISPVQWEEVEAIDALVTIWAETNTRSFNRADERKHGVLHRGAPQAREPPLGAHLEGRDALVRDAAPDERARPGCGHVARGVRGVLPRSLPHGRGRGPGGVLALASPTTLGARAGQLSSRPRAAHRRAGHRPHASASTAASGSPRTGATTCPTARSSRARSRRRRAARSASASPASSTGARSTTCDCASRTAGW